LKEIKEKDEDEISDLLEQQNIINSEDFKLFIPLIDKNR
jgi:hypothetical protein